MRFDYEYRTRDNVRHSGVIRASDREAAFSALKARGIKPACVVESSGFFNKLFGKGKRWIAIAILVGVAIVLAIYAYSFKSELADATFALDDTTRRQPLGDATIIELGIKTAWSEFFTGEGERFLARFAIPGVPVAKTAVEAESLKECLRRKIVAEATDSMEVRQVKAMVEGIKDELREYIADGGKVRDFVDRLMQRQYEEIRYYDRASREIESATSQGRNQYEIRKLWQGWNDRLRLMGMKTVPLSKTEGF